MTVRNIFASIDVNGLVKAFKEEINRPFGLDVTGQYVTPEIANALSKVITGEIAPCRLGWTDIKLLPSYTRLISSKESTIGYKVNKEDYSWIDESKGELQLNNTYNLMIRADSGDTVRWWGHSIRPNSHIQAIVSDIQHISPSSAFTNLERKTIQFYFSGSPEDPNNLLKGVDVETRSSYCIECKLNQPNTTVSYDIELMLLSSSFIHEGSLLSVPIARVVVDPTIVIN